jgi:hypothetical protein
MARTLRNSRDFGTSKYQLEEEITSFRTIAEDRNAIRTATPSLVGEMRVCAVAQLSDLLCRQRSATNGGTC